MISAQTSVSVASPPVTVEPTGRCIHELATRMKYAESQVPSATSQIVARWTRGERRSQPNTQSPRNVASSANAARPSIASGAPKTPPTNSE